MAFCSAQSLTQWCPHDCRADHEQPPAFVDPAPLARPRKGRASLWRDFADGAAAQGMARAYRGEAVMDRKTAEIMAQTDRWGTTCPGDKRQCDKVPCPYRANCIYARHRKGLTT